MSLAASSEDSFDQPEELSPRAIRALLLPEGAGDFDREYRQAMIEATESLDLTPVLGALRRWRRVAWSSQDVEAHRRMLARAASVAAGETGSSVAWEETRQRLGL